MMSLSEDEFARCVGLIHRSHVLAHRQMLEVHMLEYSTPEERVRYMHDKSKKYWDHASVYTLRQYFESNSLQAFLRMLEWYLDERYIAWLKAGISEYVQAREDERAISQGLDTVVQELSFVDLEKLKGQIVRGEVANGENLFNDPAYIQDEDMWSGTFKDAPLPTAKIHARDLANLLHELTCAESTPPHYFGVRLRRLFIVGHLNMNYLRMDHAIRFEGCYFDSYIEASHAEFLLLEFEHCNFAVSKRPFSLHGLVASYLTISHTLRFGSCLNLATLFLTDSNVGEFILEDHSARSDGSESEWYVELETYQQTNLTLTGSMFESLLVTGDVEKLSVEMGREETGVLTVGRVKGSYGDIVSFLKKNDPPVAIWDSFAQGLDGSGRGDDAQKLRIEQKRFENGKRPQFLKFLHWLFLDVTVRYFHRPSRVFWGLCGVFVIAWGISFYAAGSFVAGPMASTPVPSIWLSSNLHAAAWSFIYALDITFSPFSLGQVESMWPSSVFVTLLMAVLKSISITLLGLYLAGMTTLISKRSS